MLSFLIKIYIKKQQQQGNVPERIDPRVQLFEEWENNNNNKRRKNGMLSLMCVA